MAVGLFSNEDTADYCNSCIPASAVAINIFISSPRHLVLDIDITLSTFCDLTLVDFSPLAILGAASLSIPRIDVYVHTGVLPSALTRAQLLSSLEDDENITRAMKEGVLVIHAEKTAPDCVQRNWAHIHHDDLVALAD